MNDNLILILAILISAIIGGYLGLIISRLKSKGEKSRLEERHNNLIQQLAETKQAAETEFQKQELQFNQQLSDLKNRLSKAESDREDIRREKEFLHTELTRKSTEYDNLKQQSQNREQDIELRQEQLRKDFELLATKILEEKSEKFTLQNKENIKN